MLEGSGLAWQDDQVYEVRPGDCVIHRANELEHTFIAGLMGSSTSSSARGIRRTSAGCRARGGPVRLAVGRGTHRRSLGARGRGAAAPVRRPADRPPNILNIDEVEPSAGAGRRPRRSPRGAVRPRRLPLGAPRSGRARLGAALPPGGGGDLRHPRGRGDAPPLAVALVRGGDGRRRRSSRSEADMDRTASRDAGQPLVPRRAGRDDDADLRHAQAERHVLVPALEQDRLARARRDRADRGARVRGRRA